MLPDVLILAVGARISHKKYYRTRVSLLPRGPDSWLPKLAWTVKLESNFHFGFFDIILCLLGTNLDLWAE